MPRREEELHAAVARVRRVAVICAAVATPLLFSRGLFDSFQLVKVAVVALAATITVAATVHGWLRSGRLMTPGWRPVAIVPGVFVLAVGIAAVVSGEVAAALSGTHGRWTGAIAYLAYVALFFAAARSFDARTMRPLAWGIVGAMVLVSAYALIQAVGADPFTWGEQSAGTIFSTLGNPNFAGGYLGAVVPFGLWAATASRTTKVGVAGAAAAALGFVGAILTGTLQGIAVAAGSTIVFVLVYVWLRVPRWRRRIVAAAALLGVAVIAVGYLLTLEVGPLEALAEEGNLRFRGYYWGAAWQMFLARPILGVGLGQYPNYYSVYRSPEAAAGLNFEITTNAAHNVPLEMFASGGLVLGLAYTAFVALIGWVILRGLRRATDGPLPDVGRAALVAALVASWVGYQAQSLISIDVPALATLHWVVAGCLVAILSDAPWRERSLPWRVGRGRLTGASMAVASGLLTLLLLAALAVPLVRQFRGDGGAFGVNRFLASERVDIAITEGEKSVAAAPWQAEYWDHLARAHKANEDLPAALDAYANALDRAPRRVHFWMFAAQAAEQAGEQETARAYYERARQLDPYAPEIRGSSAQFEMRQGNLDLAAELIAEAIDVQGDRPVWWLMQGVIERERGNVDAARASFERTIELGPETEDAERARLALEEMGT